MYKSVTVRYSKSPCTNL